MEKENPQNERDICRPYVCGKELKFRIYKSLLPCNSNFIDNSEWTEEQTLLQRRYTTN